MIQKILSMAFLALCFGFPLFAQDIAMPPSALFSSTEWVHMMESTTEYEYENEDGEMSTVPGPELQLVGYRFQPDGTCLILAPGAVEDYLWSWDPSTGVMTFKFKGDDTVAFTLTLIEWDKNHLVFAADDEGTLLRLEKY